MDQVIAQRGLQQIPTPAPSRQIVDEVLARNARQVEDYRAGKDKAFNSLVGQVMKATQGKANPAQVNAILKAKLASADRAVGSCSARAAPLRMRMLSSLDEHRERHREVDVALRHVMVEPVGDQHHADHQQEREREHLDRRVRATRNGRSAPAKTIISATEAITAATITATSSTMPTAVMMESSENTRSMRMICTMHRREGGAHGGGGRALSPSSSW